MNTNNHGQFDSTRDFDIRQNRPSAVQRPDGMQRPLKNAPTPGRDQAAHRAPSSPQSRQPKKQPSLLRSVGSIFSQSKNSAKPVGSRPQLSPAQTAQSQPQTNTQHFPRNAGKRETRPVNSGLMQTRVSPIGKTDKKSTPASPAKQKKNQNTRGEGANTVISIVKAVVYIIFVLVVSVFIATAIIKIGNDVFAFVKSDEIIEVTIPENATTDDVAKVLADSGVIKYPKIFSIYSKLRKDDGVYIAGTYSVSPSENYDMLRADFKPQEVSGTTKITIPEGYSTDEIIDLMVENGIGTREGYVDVIENGEFDYWFINELEEDGIDENRIYRLDGYLFPDTYEFYLASSEWTVINKLLRRFDQIFTREYRDQCEVLGYSVDEMITLASMIEKEAANPSEFFLVSSVLHNRLKAKWTFPRFESDATVVYAIAHETGERTVDLYYDSPYNTYKYEGFPPGPISNPSASAMLAALSPQESSYYFFFSYGSRTYFSETKDEHDRIIAELTSGDGQPVIEIPEE